MRIRGRRPAWLVGVLLLLTAGACTTADTDTDTEPVETVQIVETGTAAPDDPSVVAVSVIVADLNEYWAVAAVELGFKYEPVTADRVTTGIDGAVCSGVAFDPEEIAENAFVDPSCDEGLTVAYDPDYLRESLARAEATMAHEWGHVVQAQAEHLDISLDPEGLPIDAELQADCFAGAWAVDRALADIASLRDDTAEAGDPDDVDLDDPEAHGLPEERVIAFDIGLAGGPVACVQELLDALP
jgi:predicted metalloprotease